MKALWDKNENQRKLDEAADKTPIVLRDDLYSEIHEEPDNG